MGNQVAMRKTKCHNYGGYYEVSSLLIQDKGIILYKWNATSD